MKDQLVVSYHWRYDAPGRRADNPWKCCLCSSESMVCDVTLLTIGNLHLTASLHPRILSASVRENILFSHEYDETFYNLVVEGRTPFCPPGAHWRLMRFFLSACALGPDLALLPQGDLTEVGEKGESIPSTFSSLFIEGYI